MFAQLVSLVAFSVLLTPVPTLAVPGPAWIRRQQDAQSSLTLDPAVISHGLEQDGQGDNPDPGQVRSLTSSNNFINFCLPFLDQGVVLTNGAQVTAGSCNQVPMGRIISLDLAPRCKFVFPKNGDESLVENTPFTVQMKILNMETGNFVNAQTNYYAAPQQVNDQGIVIGHSHIVIEALPSLQTTEPLDPNKFAFFKGLNNPVDGNNILSTAVTAGLPAGIYRMCSINTAANHQPALVSNAQHGALDDCSYFTVKAAGANATASATDSAAATATDAATATNAATDSATDAAATTAASTDAAQATDAATDSATDAATATDSATDAAATDAPAATDSATDVPAATDSATDAGNNDANASTDAPAATTDSAAPAATDSAATPDNSNNGNGGDNSNNNNGGGNNDNNNNGGNNDNSGNNGGNTDNSGNNGGDNANNNGGNGGNNDNNNNNGGDATNTDNNSGNAANTDNSGDSSAAPAATETPAADNNATPSQDAPTDSPSAAPEATPAQGNGDNSNAGGNDNQGGNGGDNGAASTA